MGHKSLSIVIYIYINICQEKTDFTMETLCLIDYLINGDSNGGIIREELRDNQGSLKQSVGIQWQFILSSCFFQEHLTTLSWNH